MAGCGSPIAVRTVLRALNPEDKAVVCSATSCLEVSTFMYPYTAWKDSFIHNAFENAAATISGVETAYRAMKKRGKLDDTYKFIAFGGDGGTYDIGFQSLSGAMERGHDMVYVCYDNEAYMNTGIQRSSSTPHFADTTTTPVGTVIPGKMQQKKNLTEDHGGPRHPLCGPDHLHRQLQGHHGEGPQGHLHPRPGVLERDGALPPRLAVSQREADGGHQDGGGDLRVAAVRGGGGQIHPQLQAQEQAAGGGVPEDAGPLCPHVQARQRVDDRRGPEGSGKKTGRTPPKPLRLPPLPPPPK